MKLFFSNEIIEFYCHPDLEGIIPPPIPASKKIPDWWKNLDDSFSDRDHFGSPSMTAKKCLPLLDAFTLGYIIPLQGDLQVMTNSDLSIINVVNPPGIKVAEFHDSKQLGGKTGLTKGANAIKFINTWVIKTAPGWSSLFIPPINHFNSNFTCLGGMVDTDKYPKEINFPAIWHTPNFDGKLKAGTPLVTVIPIKRKSFPTKPKVRKMTRKEFKDIDNIRKIQDTRSSYYTKELREHK
jgi:Family of unknown function (DUF6065)